MQNNMNSQQSSETDITCLMNKYNFVKPVTVTVIYEEDEEKVKEINIDDRNHSMLSREVNELPLRPTVSRNSDPTTTAYANFEIRDNYSMLLTVAQNMSNIVEAYHKYMQGLKQKEKKAVNLKMYYVHTKCENYKRSFKVAYHLLVPHKTNVRVKQFLVQKVIELSKVKIDSTYVIGLYEDLIFWTEGMKDKILTQIKFGNVNQVRNLPSSHCGKAQNVSNKLKRKSDQENFSKENKVTIFSAGQKGNEIILKVDAQYVHTASQKDKCDKRTDCQHENPQNNISSINRSTNSSNELNHPLQTTTQSNSRKHFVNRCKGMNNDNLSNVNKVVNWFNKSIPRSRATNDANPFITSLENIDNSKKKISQHNNIIAQNRPNQKQDTMPRESGESHSVSFQALLDHTISAIYSQTSETGQRTSYNSIPNFFRPYRTNTGISTHSNRNNLTTSQNRKQALYQNPHQNTNSGNADNYPTNMPLQYSSGTNHLPLRTNLHHAMITVNKHINQNYEQCNYITSNYQENYCNRSLIDQGQQTNQQYFAQNTISRDNGFTTPVTYNYSPPQMNFAAFEDRPNWVNI